MKDAEMNDGILPVQQIRDAIAAGHIAATIPPTEAQLQPASMDLRLGTRGWRARSSLSNQRAPTARIDPKTRPAGRTIKTHPFVSPRPTTDRSRARARRRTGSLRGGSSQPRRMAGARPAARARFFSTPRQCRAAERGFTLLFHLFVLLFAHVHT